MGLRRGLLEVCRSVRGALEWEEGRMEKGGGKQGVGFTDG